MIQKIEQLNKEKERETKIETPSRRTSRKVDKEVPRGRQENYFFPKEMKTIRASSLAEATEKLKKIKGGKVK